MARRLALTVALVAGACTPTSHVGRRPPTTTTTPTTTPPPSAPAATPAPPPSMAPVAEPAAPPPAQPPGPAEAAGGTELGAVSPSTKSGEAGDQTARVSWYGSESGSRTADGTAFDGTQLVFAHRSMAFGTLVRFCGPLGCVVARCADRGPFVAGRLFDLSRAAFGAIAPLGAGVATVTWEAA